MLNSNNDRYIFSDNVDIRNLYYLVNISINNNTNMKNIKMAFNDYYVLKYYRIGKNKDNTYTNYMKVFTLPNTNQILTIYPVSPSDIQAYDNIIEITDFNIENSEEIKRESQIYKFKRKYKIL